MFSKNEDYIAEVELIEAEDDKIDILEKSVRFFLAELSEERLSSAQVQTQIALLSISARLEEIGDTISKELKQLAIKKGIKCRIFSDEGWTDLRSFQAMVLENFDLMLSILTQPSEEILRKIEHHDAHMNDVEEQLRHAHLMRLHHGLKEAFDTSSIHLDVLSGIRRISSKVTDVARLSMKAK